MDSFYTKDELTHLHFKSIGENVKISRKCSIYGSNNISIGNDVRIDDFCILSGNILLGNHVHIAAYVALFAGNFGIIAKDYAGVSSRSVIYAASDDYSGNALTNPTIPDSYRNIIGGKIVIGEHALIGTGCTVLPGCSIGTGTSVGSMSLVNIPLSSWGIYVGIPCKRIKERSKQLISLQKKFECEQNEK